MQRVYAGPAVLFAYGLGALAVVSGYWLGYEILIISLLILLAWDIGFVFSGGAFAGRNVGDINDSVTRARTYISWFMALYGIVFGLVFSAASDVRDLVAAALSNAHVPIWLLALPFALTLICMLFIPIALEGDKEDSASTALRGLFAFVIYSEKVILILLGHLVFRLISAWPGGAMP